MRAARIGATLIAVLLAARLIYLLTSRHMFADDSVDNAVVQFAAAVFLTAALFGHRLRSGGVMIVLAAGVFVIGYIGTLQPAPRYPLLEWSHIYGLAAILTALWIGIGGLALIGVALLSKLAKWARRTTAPA